MVAKEADEGLDLSELLAQATELLELAHDQAAYEGEELLAPLAEGPCQEVVLCLAVERGQLVVVVGGLQLPEEEL